MNNGDSISVQLVELLNSQLPRILTQACRNPESPTYGCFDRNWWHYKIRDFPSLIQQQGGYMLQQARMSGIAARLGIPDTRRLERASVFFWAKRAEKFGAFEEYYPWERGYPPLAFSTLAVAKIVSAEPDLFSLVRPQLALAARQLTRRFESQAANQQVAGLAAMAWLHRLDPILIPKSAWTAKRDATLALQHTDGWFEEYGGPDLGYLSVTIDCLWDIVDANNDERALDAIERSIVWSHPFVGVTHGNIGMHNSRNTDYLVPYGFARTASSTLRSSPMAHEILTSISADLNSPQHPLRAIDDRYWTHYIGHSVVRAAEVAEANHLTAVAIQQPQDRVFPSSGHRIAKLQEGQSLLLSTSKGGNASIHNAKGITRWCNWGWILETPDRKFGMNWQSSEWTVSNDANSLTISGPLVRQKFVLGSPTSHIFLRLASFVMGPKLIGVLKKALIFRRKRSPWRIERKVRWDRSGVVITDSITGPSATAIARPAPRSSNRHVSSADSYHREDFIVDRGEPPIRVSGTTEIVSRFSC